MMKYEIKELELGGIIDNSISLFRNHFTMILILLSVFLLPAQLLMTFARLGLMPDSQSFDPEMVETTQQVPSLGFIGLFLLSAIFYFLAHAITQGAITYGISQAYLGKDISAGYCLKTALRQLHRLAGTAIVYGLGIVGGTFLCIIPGIYLAFAWYIIYPVLMLEDLKVLHVFGRSHSLMKGHMTKAFVAGLVLAIMGFGIGMMAGLLPGIYLSNILSSVISAFFIALNCIVVTVIYFSARCKVENFDLDLLAQLVEKAAPTPQEQL